MKKVLIVLFIFLLEPVIAQSTELSLKDLMAIESRENFERVLIENNFHREDVEDLDLTNIVQGIDDENAIVVAYSFDGMEKYGINPSVIMALGIFIEKDESKFSDKSLLTLMLSTPENEYSVYNIIYSEVKEKCTFDEIRRSDDDDMSVALYTCESDGKKKNVGFQINKELGMIIIKNGETESSEATTPDK